MTVQYGRWTGGGFGWRCSPATLDGRREGPRRCGGDCAAGGDRGCGAAARSGATTSVELGERGKGGPYCPARRWQPHIRSSGCRRESSGGNASQDGEATDRDRSWLCRCAHSRSGRIRAPSKRYFGCCRHDERNADSAWSCTGSGGDGAATPRILSSSERTRCVPMFGPPTTNRFRGSFPDHVPVARRKL